MNKAEFRTVRMQFLLTAGLFLGSLGLAIVIASQRDRFESFLGENYSARRDALSPVARELFDDINRGKGNADIYAQLKPPERVALYELWMLAGDEASSEAPRALVQLDGAFFLRRAEQTAVGGNSTQRTAALKFLRLSGAATVPAILDRLVAWAQKRKREDWAAEFQGLRKSLDLPQAVSLHSVFHALPAS